MWILTKPRKVFATIAPSVFSEQIQTIPSRTWLETSNDNLISSETVFTTALEQPKVAAEVMYNGKKCYVHLAMIEKVTTHDPKSDKYVTEWLLGE